MLRKRMGLALAATALLTGLLWPGTSSATPEDHGGEQQVVPVTGLTNAEDVEVDALGNLYVADTGNNRVVKVSPGGTQVTLGFTGLSGPRNLTLTKNGDVYVSDLGNSRVVMLPAAGGSQVVVANGITPRGLALDAAGNLYIAGNSCGCVYKKAAGQSTLSSVNVAIGNVVDVKLDATGANFYAVAAALGAVAKMPVGGGAQTYLDFSDIGLAREFWLDAAGNAYVSTTSKVVEIPAGGTQITLGFNDLLNSAGMTIDTVGNIYVADAGHSRILKMPARTGTTGSGTLTFSPKALALDTAGNRYATDTASGVYKVTPGGTQTTLGFSGVSNLGGVAVDTGGNVYLSDGGTGRVLKLPPGGSQTTLGFSSLSVPSGVAVDLQGNVYVADADSNFVEKLPIGGGAPVFLPFSGLSAPQGVAVDRTGAVYVADYGNNRVLKMPAGGSTQEVLPFTGVTSPRYVAVDRDLNVFVTGAGNQVTELAGGGDAQLNPTLPGLSGPSGLAVDKDGTLFVADSGNNKIVSLATTMPELRVTTNPAVGADVIVDGIARDSWGLNWAQYPPGDHQVCFGDYPGLTKPACQTANLKVGATSVVQGNYTANGYLRAITSPAVQSTISVGGVPRNEYGLWAEVPPGTYNVCFGAVKGYNPPACRDVTVTAGTTATTTGTFTVNASASGPTGAATGYLRAVTNPAVAGMISVDGQWRDNWGLNWVKIPVGPHEVCFGPMPNTEAPPCQTATITDGNTSVITGNYTVKGFLRVNTSPALHGAVYVNREVANDWGMWTSKAPGTYEVCFGPVVGYTAPACQAGVAVTAGNTTTITGTYTASD